jgi:hypothetical protein
MSEYEAAVTMALLLVLLSVLLIGAIAKIILLEKRIRRLIRDRG